MRSYKVKPYQTNIYYDFQCPYCKYIIYKNKAEVEKYKYDICYCGAQIVFDIEEKKELQIIPQKELKKEKVYKEEASHNLSNRVAFEKPTIGLKPIPVKKTYDDKPYIALLKSLGMKVGPAKALILDLIKLGYDPKDEQVFTQKLLENMK